MQGPKELRTTLLVFVDMPAVSEKFKRVQSISIRKGEKLPNNIDHINRVLVFRKTESPLDGTYIKVPFHQDTGFAVTLVEQVRAHGQEVGAYSPWYDIPYYGVVGTDRLCVPLPDGTETYEIVLQSPSVLPMILSLMHKSDN